MAEHEAFHKKKELGNSRTRRPRGEVWGSAIRSADIGRPDQSNGIYEAWISFNVKDAKYAGGRIYTELFANDADGDIIQVMLCAPVAAIEAGDASVT